MDDIEVSGILTQDALVDCKEANTLAKRIFKRISNEDNISLQVKVLEIKKILNDGINKPAYIYMDNKIEEIDNIESVQIIQDILTNIMESDENYKIYVQSCVKLFPNLCRQVNPGSLKDLSEEIKDKIRLFLNNQQEKKIFVSDPIIRYDSIFFFIIELDEKFYNKYVILPPVEINRGKWLTSFIYQIIDVLFDYWRESAYLQLKVCTTSLGMSDDEIIRLAAQDMTEGRKLPNLNVFNKISSQNYEGRSCKGRIAFIDNESEIENYIGFEKNIEITEKNIRHIRKLLEMTGDCYYLCSKQNIICGFGKITKNLNIQNVEFLGYAKWRLLYNDKEILRSHSGEILLPKSNLDDCNYIRIIEHFFYKSKKPIDFDYIKSIIEEAAKQTHGTMILISDEAQEEAARLCGNGRGTKIQPLKLYKDSIKKLTSIDGALMIDLNGICYGIGIIVDGISKGEGAPERGARYNSAKDYINFRNKNRKSKCIAVVISEDKSVDIIN